MSYLFHLAIFFCMYAILALSLNLILRFCGYLSLAHSAYFAVGAYVYALLTLGYGWSFIPIILIAAALAAVLSLFLSLAAWRLKGDFFVMISLAVQSLTFATIFNWASPNDPPGSWKNLTNGSYGLPGIPKPDILGVTFATESGILVISIMLLALITSIYYVLINSPWGRTLMALRDDELAARNLGKRARVFKMQTFGIACGMAAVAGALYASYVGFVDPNISLLEQSILILCMVIVGGSRPLMGPLLGVGIILLIPEVLRRIDLPDSIDVANLRVLVYGLLLVTVAHFGGTIRWTKTLAK
jgi:branched-chain amino acid transport system permease protein